MKITLDAGAYTPTRAHQTDAGLDIRAPRGLLLLPGETVLVDTGLHVQLPQNTVGIIKSKSGNAINRGIRADCGVIDEGYTGSIGVLLTNGSGEMQRFAAGDKIAQLLVVPCLYPDVEVVDELPPTDRGANGFGSTGMR